MADRKSSLAGVLERYLGQQVVLDTADYILFLGTLTKITDSGFWLENADLHDCRDGHATKEMYIYDAKTSGIRPNRSRIFVLRSTVIAVSALAEVVTEDLGESGK